MDGDLNFFKTITPRVSDEGRLQLPPGCRKRMEALSNTVTFRDRYKNLWQVEIAKHGGDWYFTKGWMKFFYENFLEVGDALLFEYKGNDMFDFRIIGSTVCDKEGATDPSFIVRDDELELVSEEEEESSEELEEVEEEEDEKDTETNDSYETKSSDDDYVEDETDDGDEDFVQDKEKYEEEGQVYVPKKLFKSKSKSKAFGKSTLSSSSRATQLGVGTIPHRRKYRKKNGCYGSDIFKAGLLRRPKNPFFVSRSRPESRPNELHIPNEVIKDNKLSIPVKFHLVDEEGRKWGTRIRQWNDGRLWCIRGWDTLCKVNGIQRDDACVCEFVQGQDDKDFCMKVRLVRN